MSKVYETVIGLEVHVELASKTKIFCGCSTAFGGAPNSHTCPVCTGMPGSLPVLNKQVVEYAIAVGLATNCSITQYCKFDRKNYFYPDNPQNYQISQLYLPICRNGGVEIETVAGKKTVGIHEIHMEEDAGKLVHDEWEDCSIVDYNRSGVPLIEIVSEPDMRSAEEVIAYLEKLRLIIQYLGASDCKLNEGSMRADVNLSVREMGAPEFGTRTEMKNLNSFKAIARAIEGERTRQIELIEEGKKVIQETRRWDDNKEYSYAMRSKEDAQDYRYFPDPDLVMLHITKEHIEEMKAQMPEMPRERRNRLKGEWGFNDLEMRDVLNADALDLLEDTVKAGASASGAKKWWLGELSREANNKGVSLEELPITPADVAEVEKLIASGKLNDKLAKQTVEGVLKGEGTPDEVVKKHDYKIVEDNGAIEAAVDAAFEANPDVVEKLKSGNMKPMGVIIGAVMKATRGQADAKAVTKVVMGKIKG